MLTQHHHRREYVCPVPNFPYSANQKSNYETHLKTHTGEKALKCDDPRCTFIASDPANMSRHRSRGAHEYEPTASDKNTRTRTPEEVRIASEILNAMAPAKRTRRTVKREVASPVVPSPVPAPARAEVTPPFPSTSASNDGPYVPTFHFPSPPCVKDVHAFAATPPSYPPQPLCIDPRLLTNSHPYAPPQATNDARAWTRGFRQANLLESAALIAQPAAAVHPYHASNFQNAWGYIPPMTRSRRTAAA